MQTTSAFLHGAIIFGIALKSMGSGTTKTCLNDIAAAITKVVTWVIHFAPLGIMGLVAESVGTAGLEHSSVMYSFWAYSSAPTSS